MTEGETATMWGQKGRYGLDHTGSSQVMLRILVVTLRALGSHRHFCLFTFLKFIFRKIIHVHCTNSKGKKGYFVNKQVSHFSLSSYLLSPAKGNHANFSTILPKIVCAYMHKHYILSPHTHKLQHTRHTALNFSFSTQCILDIIAYQYYIEQP